MYTLAQRKFREVCPERHFSLENLTSAVYISHSGYTLIFGAKGEGSPVRPPFAGCRLGRSLHRRLWSIPMSSIGAAKACAALWTVSRAAPERDLIRICIKPLDKSHRSPYLLYGQWLTVESRFTHWVLMLQNQRCLGSYTEPYIHC